MKRDLLLTTILAANVGLTGAAWAQDGASAGSSNAEATSAPASEVDEVVVTGFRSSLAKAVELKKEAIAVRDSIVAEDIGKFPEANVAEALQRIPGVYLSRDGASNEGQRISIRGLGSDYNVTTLNGAPARTTSSSNVGGSSRDFNYDVFASELFGRVDFYKTPLAELEEGGIGGVVDLQTPRPFDSPGRTIRYQAVGSYNDKSKHLDPAGFALFSNTWGDFGLLVAFAHSTSVNNRSGFEATGGYNSHALGSQNPVKGPFAVTLDFDDPRYSRGSLTRAQIENGYLPRFYRYYGGENDRMRVVPGAQGWPEAYEYTAAGRTVRFAQDGAPPPILHLSLLHPLDDHYGLAPVEAAAVAVDTHNAAAKWNKALLDNAARPSGALTYAAAEGALLSDAQYERLKHELEAQYQGTANAGRPLLLEGGLDWKAMALTPKDMDFLQAKHAAAREIALAFGVPPMLLGIPGDNTYANYQEANRALWRQTVLPLGNRLACALAHWLGSAYGPEVRLAIDSDRIDALSSDRASAWERISAAPFLTLNEKREALGYSPLEGGDALG